MAALDRDGNVLDAGWTIGLAATVDWIDKCAEDDTLLFVDAPLIVDNTTGQRFCETEVGSALWPSKMSANTTNLGSRNLAGVALLQALVGDGWRYDDGRDGPPHGGRIVSACYPYTAIVGVAELGFDIERPRYTRQPKGMSTASASPRPAGHERANQVHRQVGPHSGVEVCQTSRRRPPRPTAPPIRSRTRRSRPATPPIAHLDENMAAHGVMVEVGEDFDAETVRLTGRRVGPQRRVVEGSVGGADRVLLSARIVPAPSTLALAFGLTSHR